MPPADEARRLNRPDHLGPEHDCDSFSCGNADLDDWLKRRARQSEGQTARTYVACEDRRVVGYYCILSGAVERGELPSRLRRQQGLPATVPVAIIGRLACDLAWQRKGLGADLLRDALARIYQASQTLGIRAVLVHAIDDRAAAFYRRHGFRESHVGDHTLMLSVGEIAAAL
ncbi:MAG: GNAT family N-acetyltransferase [Flavobacteriaceae bacterium]